MATKLKVSREETTRKIKRQIKAGQRIRKQADDLLLLRSGYPQQDQQRVLEEKADIWKEYTIEVLYYCFIGFSEAQAFKDSYENRGYRSFSLSERIGSALTTLKSVLCRLPLFLEEVTFSSPTATSEVREAEEEEVFKHTDDYVSVILRGKSFTLTSRQAEVIQLLHEAYKNDTPNLHQEGIKRRLNMGDSARVRDRFRGSPDTWKHLIAKGARKGTFRLNI